jgi:hypothetical protein
MMNQPPPPPPAAAPQEPKDTGDIYDDSSIFTTNKWRKASRVADIGEDAGTFAQGLVSEDPISRGSMFNKKGLVSGGGLFDGAALKN